MSDTDRTPRSGPSQLVLTGIALAAILLAAGIVIVALRVTRTPDAADPDTADLTQAPTADEDFLISASLPADATPDEARLGALNLLFAEGATINAAGEIDTSHLLDAITGGAALIPVITPKDNTARRALLTAPSLLEMGEMSGIAFDFGALSGDEGEALLALVAAVDDDAVVAVMLPTPEQNGDSWETHGYDWAAFADAADILIVAPAGTPADYADGGAVADLLGWAADEIDLSKLLIATSPQSIDHWGARLTPVATDFALNPLGRVITVRDDPAASPQQGDPLTFTLRGDATDLTLDDTTGTLRYTVLTGDGEHTVYVVTPAALRARLDWLHGQGIGGVLLTGFAADNDDPAILTAVQEFRTGRQSTLNGDLALQWTVTDAAGAVLYEETTPLEGTLNWTPASEGEYIVYANVTGETPYPRGAEAVIVGGANIGVAPEQEGIVVGGGPTPAPGSAQPTPVPLPEGMPAPLVPAGARGNFELGGQVNHVINDPERMKAAGMEWVKFQLAWGDGDTPSNAWTLVEQGREQGFKVLLSVPGNHKYPTEINIESYLDYLRGVAYYGPDAIEVWNEANLDFEWPRGRINGANYVREMLAPAYNAIKSVNPNIMVISGALAPTGAFYGDGGCSTAGYGCDDWLYLQQMAEAGAANYMDCVGAHFNSGATAPSAATGHPADPGYQHYSWYFGGMLQLYGGMFGKPVCFTELGYLSGEGYGSPPERFNWASDTSVAEQAAWLAEAAQLSRDSGNVRLMIVWNFDFNYWGDDPMAGYAIVRPDGSCPACQTLGAVMN